MENSSNNRDAITKTSPKVPQKWLPVEWENTWMHKVVFTPLTLPSKAIWNFFVHFYVTLLFIFLYLLRTIQLLYISFLQLSLGVVSLTKPCYSISHSTGSHFEVLLGSFWWLLLYYWSYFPSSCMKFYRCF